MYPEELQQFIRERNYLIGGDDLLRVISFRENPQLIIVHYDPQSNHYRMVDRYGNVYEFECLSYVDAVAKGLVKKRK